MHQYLNTRWYMLSIYALNTALRNSFEGEFKMFVKIFICILIDLRELNGPGNFYTILIS